MSKIPHMIKFPGNNGTFGDFWGKKEVRCRKCLIVHMLKTSCEDAQRERDGVDENEAANPRPVDLGSAATLSQPQTHSSEDAQRDRHGVDENGAVGPKPVDLGPAATLSQHQTHSSEMGRQDQNESLGRNFPKEIDKPLQVSSENEGYIYFDSETGEAGLSGQESRNKNVTHDPWSDDPVHQISDQMLVPKESHCPNAGSRDANEGQFSTASAKNAEMEEDPLKGLETANLQHLLSSHQIPQSDVESSATAIVVVSEPPSDSVDKGLYLIILMRHLHRQ